MTHRELLPLQEQDEQLAVDCMVAEGAPDIEYSAEKLRVMNNYLEGDAESFLVNNAPLWCIGEAVWRSVRGTKAKIYDLCEAGLHLDIKADSITYSTVEAGSPRKARRASRSDGSAFGVVATEGALRQASNLIVHTADLGRFDDSYLLRYDTSETGAVIGDMARAITPIAERNVAQLTSRMPVEIAVPSELDQAGQQLTTEYFYALATQKIAETRIAEFLSHDANVVPFLEQVTDLIETRKQGPDEFVGFLELLATQISAAENKGTHPLQEALARTAEQRHPRRDFVAAMLNGEEAQGGKLPKEFLGSVSGVKLAAGIIGRRFSEQGVDKEAIIEAITDNFDELPPEWESAYKADTKSKCTQTWQALRTELKPYERRGRITPDKRMPLTVDSQAKFSGVKRRKNTTDSPPQADVALVPTEEEALPRQLAVMRRVDGTANEYGLDFMDDVAALLGHSAFSKFLDTYRNEPGMTDLLSSMLTEIYEVPYDGVNSKILRVMRFTVRDEKVRRQQTFRLRRHRPHSSSVKTGSQGHKVRILYGVIPSTEKNRIIVGVQGIEMRRQAY